MVMDERSIREQNDEQRPNNSPDRGQVILIGAIALAFIILGVVVVFNGVLYTETLSSSDTGQSAATAEKTELEVTQGVSCLIVGVNDEVDLEGMNDTEIREELEPELRDEIQKYNEIYQNATAESSPTGVNVSLVETGVDIDRSALDQATVTIAYDSTDISYEQERTIDADDCPGES
ncbi:hypothetical protein [Natronorubrum sp. FCH18a]|uniref:hypothetical protein n=1 Tax=Natronorubrum sp. FCH18a TaxID=3447018 RepID=UPI003F5183BE